MRRGSVVPGFLDAGTWSATFGLAWSDLMMRDQAQYQRIVREGGQYLRRVCGTGGISAGRNQLVQAFLDDTDGEWLWMVDTDMSFSDDAVERLVQAADEHQRPVVGGLCFALLAGDTSPHYGRRSSVIPTIYQWLDDPVRAEAGFSPVPAYPPDSLVQCAGTGAAMLLLHRRVLTKMRARHGDVWFDHVRHPTAGAGGTPRTFSEDLSFCVRLAGLGEPLYVHTGVTTAHHKGPLFLDHELFAEQQRALAVPDQELVELQEV